MIGKVIKHILENAGAVIAIVPTARIFPYVMNEGTDMPAIIYTIDGLTPGYTKDGWANDEIGFSVVSFSKNYTQLQTLVAAIRTAMELEDGTIEAIHIGRIYLNSMVEAYSVSEDTFLNKLTFNVNVIHY